MLSLKKKQAKVSAEIHLSPNVDKTSASQPNVLLSNEDLSGHVVFRLAPGADFSHSKIALRGLVTTKTDNAPDSLQRNWRTEKLPFLGVVLDSTARPDFKTNDGVVKIPFRFNLDDIHAQTRSPFIKELPPSVNSRDESGFKWSDMRKNELEGQYDVTYTISASAYSKKGLLVSTTETIPILSVSQVQPPLSPSDFPGEYFYAASTPQPSKMSLSKPPPFRLEVGGQEPGAIVLDAHETFSTGSTTVPFTIKALPRSSSNLDIGSLPTQCVLRARLVSKTLITPDRVKEKAIPTLDQAIGGRDASLRVQKSDEQEFTLSIPRWNHVALGLTDEFALANFSFMFNITSDKAPIPTFYTPLLSRRYAIEVTMSFPGSSTPSLKLSLPLQIVYEVDEFDYIKPAKVSV